MNSEQVRYILRQYRSLKSMKETHDALYIYNPHNPSCKTLDRKVAIIESWFLLLTEDELFVVTKHLFELVPWPAVTEAYEEKWGLAKGKDERTLKRYMKRATEKISRHIDSTGWEPRIALLFFPGGRCGVPESGQRLLLLKGGGTS